MTEHTKILIGVIEIILIVGGFISLYLYFGSTKRIDRIITKAQKLKGGMMQDSKGNVIEVSDKLKSEKSPEGCGLIECIDISFENIATMEWVDKRGERFRIDRENLINSKWVKV